MTYLIKKFVIRIIFYSNLKLILYILTIFFLVIDYFELKNDEINILSALINNLIMFIWPSWLRR